MKIINMYITMMPLILSGIFNMIFVKSSLYKKYNYPIDNYIVLKDGKRLFGNNKTIIGFISMIVFSICFQVLWGLYCLNLMKLSNEWYNIFENTILNNVKIGFYVGFIYMLFELPNSFIKRRLGIQEGKTDIGLKGIIFFIVDQIDSLIGVFIFLKLYSNLNIYQYFEYLLLGGLTHIIINLILYIIKVRKNI